MHLVDGGRLLDLAGTLVAVNHHAGSRRLGIGKPERARDGPVAEEAFARAHHDRKDPEAKLVDEVVLQQGLDQVGAPGHVNLASGPLLESRHGGRGFSLQQRRVGPLHFAKRPRGDVLWHPVQLRRDRIVRIRDARPVGGEDLVRPAAKQQGVRLQRLLDDDLAHHLIPILHRPTAVLEAPVAVLLWPTRSLHYAIECHEGAGH